MAAGSYMDVRMSMTLHYESGKNEVICFDNGGFERNGVVYVLKSDFWEYLDDLIYKN